MTERTGRSRPRPWGGAARWLAQAAATALLAGCQTAQTGAAPAIGAAPEPVTGAATASAPQATPEPADARKRPVLEPAPEEFSSEAWALWDGRRTLGGIWVALPDADRARRVRITNEETGAAVDGALLRRRPDASGPILEISGEAAEALGLAPDTPTAVVIVALAYPEPAPDDPASDPALGAGAAAPADTAGDDAGAEAATVAAAEAGSAAPATEAPETAAAPVPPLPTGPEPGTAVAESAAGTANSAPAAPIDAVADPARPVRAAAPKPAPEPEIAAAAPEAPTAEAPPTAVPAPTGGGDAAFSGVAAVLEPDPVAAAPQPAVPAPAIADGRRYIQAGIFAREANAARLIETMEAAGLPAEGRPLVKGGTKLIRVVVGPFETTAERDSALRTVRQIGPADAVPVRG